MRPKSGSMVYWRFKKDTPGPWAFGYVTWLENGLIRMGPWNGCDWLGIIVNAKEIEWKPCNR